METRRKYKKLWLGVVNKIRNWVLSVDQNPVWFFFCRAATYYTFAAQPCQPSRSEIHSPLWKVTASLWNRAIIVKLCDRSKTFLHLANRCINFMEWFSIECPKSGPKFSWFCITSLFVIGLKSCTSWLNTVLFVQVLINL